MRSAKRLKTLILITAYLLIMTITVFAASYIVAHAEDGAITEEQQNAPWYEIADGNTLMVYLDDDNDTCQWKYAMSDENIIEMAWFTHTSGEGYVASFKPTGIRKGQVTVSYNLINNYEDGSIENHAVKVAVNDDGTMNIVE